MKEREREGMEESYVNAARVKQAFLRKGYYAEA